MQGLSEDAETPLSAWRVDSENKVYAKSLRDVEPFVDPVVADLSVTLVDPPLQLEEISAAREGREFDDSRDESILSKAELKEMEDSLTLTSKYTKRVTTRPAPSILAEQQEVNTIEVVKQNGIYSVVLDSVSYGSIERDGLTGDFEDVHYWMPRFKETKDEKGNRALQPVVVSVRLEEYETPPKRCTLRVLQRVVNDGTVVMEREEAKTEDLKPYSVSDATCNVTILPYPIISTPEPHFVVNDYSRMREAEIMLTLTKDNAFFKRTRDFLSNSLKQAASRGEKKTMGWRDYAEWAAALAVAIGGASVGGSLAASGFGGLGSVFAWQFLSSAFKTRDYEITDKERERYLGIHEAECGKEPTQYTFTMKALASSLLRLAETRANGSLVDGSDRTIGYSVHDLGSKKWRAEAALLMWLQYGEMNRVKSDKDKPDPVSGRYSTEQNIEQNRRMKEESRGVPGITGNTISLIGMDPLSVSNTRTQFSFEIVIEEQDGTYGPTIHIDATRMNGVDAGWISSGYDKLFQRCRDTATWLEVKLMTLPGVGHWFRGHSTLVADTNNGVIVGDAFDMDLNATLGRELGDRGPENTAEKVKKSAEREAAKEKIATNRRKASEKKLLDLNKQVKKYKADLQKAESNYNEKLQKNERETSKKISDKINELNSDLESIKNDERKSPEAKEEAARNRVKRHETAVNKLNSSLKTKNERLGTTYRSRKTTLESGLSKYKGKAVTADSDLLEKQKAERVREIRTKAASKARQFANIFDYNETRRRLWEVILGDQYDEITETEVAKELDRARKENASQRSFWRRVMSSSDTELEKFHADECLESLSGSLSLPLGVLNTRNVMFLRFLNAYSPFSTKKNTGAMKMASFVVPSRRHWEVESRYGPSNVARVLPQIVMVSKSLVSTFGQVSVMRVVGLESSALREQPKAVSSVASSRKSFSKMGKGLASILRNLNITDGSCHFVQMYFRGARWAELSPYALTKEINTSTSLVNTTSMSAIPTLGMILNLQTASDAGGSSYAKTERFVSGKNTGGTSSILKQLGIPRTYGSLLAMEAFADIFTLYAMGHGVRIGTQKEDVVRRDELVFGSLYKARQSAIAIGNFVMDQYVRKSISLRMLQKQDVAFHCLPGLMYLKAALRVVVGLGADGYTKRVPVTETELQRSFANSLVKIAASSSTPFRIMPFVSVQSILSTIPQAALSVFGHRDAFATHVSFLYHSFQRLLAMTHVLKDTYRPFVALLVDCLCSRPIFLKAMYTSPELCASVITEARFVDTQANWSIPQKATTASMLRHRLASLRINVERELSSQVAVAKGKTQSRDENNEAYNILVQSMLKLDVRDLSSVSYTKSATFVVPFGSLWSSTPADMSHMRFEMQPVWVSYLNECASLAFVDASQDVHPDRHTVIDTGGTFRGKAMHPYAITVTEKTVALVMDYSERIESVGGAELKKYPDTYRNITSLAKMINSDEEVTVLSGQLSQAYRASMHNAERIFQACTLVASGAYHDVSKDHSVHVSCDADPGILSGCACIGAAIASSETGVQTKAYVIDGSSSEKDKLRVREVASLMQNMCRHLSERGVKAVPFSEVCACVSIL